MGMCCEKKIMIGLRNIWSRSGGCQAKSYLLAWHPPPKKTWREIVEKDCKARELNREDAMDCGRWRKQIGMIDDHSECEWVNVSSGTGLSRTKSTEP